MLLLATDHQLAKACLNTQFNSQKLVDQPFENLLSTLSLINRVFLQETDNLKILYKRKLPLGGFSPTILSTSEYEVHKLHLYT